MALQRQGIPPRRSAYAGKVAGLPRTDAPKGGQGKPCGESYIPRTHKCSKNAGPLTAANLKTAAKVALAVGALAGGIYLTKKGSFIRKEEWDKHPANKLNNPKLTEAEAQKIADEAIAGGQKWDVQEKINARRRAEIHIECGGGLGKLLAPAKFDSYSSSPRCQAGEGAFGTYFVHPSEKYGVKLFRNGSYDDVASEFRRLDKADYAGVNVPSPLRVQAIKDIDGNITSQTLVLTHMKGYKTLGDVHSDGSNSARNAPTIVKRNIARQFRALHTAGLAHGDIHAGNLMVNPRSRKVALIDFGYATELPDRRQPSHGRNGVENLMDDLRRLPDFLGFPRTANAGGSTFIAKYKGVFANVEKQAQAFSKYGGRDNEQRFEIAVKRYHDALDTELLGEFRMPRSRFISGADQPRIPGLTRQLVAGNLNTVQRGIVEKLAVQVGDPSHFRQVAKGIGLNSARLRVALAPERGARIAQQRRQPLGTPFPRPLTTFFATRSRSRTPAVRAPRNWFPTPLSNFGSRTRSLAADLPANARGTAGRLSLAARMQRILARSGNENMSREAALRLARNEQRGFSSWND